MTGVPVSFVSSGSALRKAALSGFTATIRPEDVWGIIFINHNGKYPKGLNDRYKGRLSSSFFDRLSSSPTTGFLKPAAGTVPFFPGRIRRRSSGQPERFLFFWPIPFPWKNSLFLSRKEKACVLMAANKWKRTAERAVHGAFSGRSSGSEAPSRRF